MMGEAARMLKSITSEDLPMVAQLRATISGRRRVDFPTLKFY